MAQINLVYTTQDLRFIRYGKFKSYPCPIAWRLFEWHTDGIRYTKSFRLQPPKTLPITFSSKKVYNLVYLQNCILIQVTDSVI